MVDGRNGTVQGKLGKVFGGLLAVGLSRFVLLMRGFRRIDSDQTNCQFYGPFLDLNGISVDDPGDLVFAGPSMQWK